MTNMATRVQSVNGQRGAYVEHVMQKSLRQTSESNIWIRRKKVSTKKLDFMWQFWLYHKILQPFSILF